MEDLAALSVSLMLILPRSKTTTLQKKKMLHPVGRAYPQAQRKR